MTLAVIKTGGKQHLVTPGMTLDVEKLIVSENGQVVFDQVLLIADGEAVKVGTPIVDGAKVVAELIDQVKDDKVIVFKMKRRKRYRKMQGHRQQKSRVKVLEIKG